MTIWLNGSFVAKDEARISVFDHGLLYGDGLFEGIRAYDGRIFRLKPHLERLYDGARAISLAIPHSLAELAALTEETVRRESAAGNPNCYVRLLLTRGEGALGLDPASCPTPGLVIIADRIQLYPAEYYQKGIPVISSSYRRNAVDSLDPRIKGLNYLNNILARIQARQVGAQEAILLNHQGYVAECTGDNIIVVKHGVLKVPAAHHGALAGITLQAVLEIAADLGMTVDRGGITLFDVHTADEVFLTGTGAEIVGVSSVDGRPIRPSGAASPGGDSAWRPGPVLGILKAEFQRRLAADPVWFAGS
jgi:branched-chain amino acid aminotransferase